MSKKMLDGRVAVITGASKGLGKAMALALGEAGASIALVARHLEPLSEVGRAIQSAGGEGYASEMGRHLREGRVPSREEAELLLGISAALVNYLLRRNHPPNPQP